MKVVVERCLGGSAGATRGPIDRSDGDIAARSRKGGCSRRGTISCAGDSRSIRRNGHRSAGAHIDDQGDFPIVDERRYRGVVDLDAVIFVGGPTGASCSHKK